MAKVHGPVQTFTLTAPQAVRQAVHPRFTTFDRWSKPSSEKTHLLHRTLLHDEGISKRAHHLHTCAEYKTMSAGANSGNKTVNFLEQEHIFSKIEARKMFGAVCRFLPDSDSATIKQMHNTSDIKSGLISGPQKMF